MKSSFKFIRNNIKAIILVHPESKPPPPPLPTKPVIIEPPPENKNTVQQTHKKEEKKEVSDSYENHRRTKSEVHRQQESTSFHDSISLVDGPFYTENSGTIVRTIYEAPRGEYPGYLKEKKKKYGKFVV